MNQFKASFDQYEADCLAFLSEHFDKKGDSVKIKEFPRYEELGHNRVLETISRFIQLRLIESHTREKIRVLPSLLDVVSQLRRGDRDTVYDIFISYSSTDSGIANEIRVEIEKHGIRTFMAEKDISVSSNWKDTIRDALRSSTRVLILLTPNSIHRHWVLLETGAAWALGKDLIPAMAYVSPNDFPDPLKDIQARRMETTEQKVKLVADIVALHSK